MILKNKLYAVLIVIVLLLPLSYAYKTDTHEHITSEAIKLVSHDMVVSKEFKDDLSYYKKWVIEGSRLEDDEEYSGECNIAGLGKSENTIISGGHPYCNHFWYTLGSTASRESKGLQFLDQQYGSSYTRAEKLFQQAINEYNNNQKEEAFLNLGRALHLLQDASVPAHLHNDVHIGDGYTYLSPVYVSADYAGDSYEEYLGNSQNSNIYSYQGKKLDYNTNSLFDVLKEQAEFSDDFPSDDVDGDTDGIDRSYIKRTTKVVMK